MTLHKKRCADEVTGIIYRTQKINTKTFLLTHLSFERRSSHGRIVLAVAHHEAAADLLHRHVLDVEADVVAGQGLGQGLVVHLHGLDLGGQVGGREGDNHAGLQDPGLHAADGDGSDT